MNTPSTTTNPFHQFYELCTRGIHFLYTTCIKPQSTDEDTRRRELILNIILSGSLIFLTTLEGILIALTIIENTAYRGLSPVWFSCIVAFFAILLLLSRTGWQRFSSYALIIVYFIGTTYGLFFWSALVPPIFLTYVLIIVTTSVLLGTRAGFWMTVLVVGVVALLSHLQHTGIIPVQLYWAHEPLSTSAVIQDGLIVLCITTISWLSNREIERSLARAHRSEQELRDERDTLEVRVEERTRDLKQLQAEKLNKLYRSVEFGRLSSGLFHDLMNPLNGVIAHVAQLERTPDALPEVKDYLEKAVAASKRMGDFLASVRKQLQSSNAELFFSVNKEVQQAIEILQYRAREEQVKIILREKRELSISGNPLKFHQIAVNLIANAIDACASEDRDTRRIVTVTISKYEGNGLLKVSDTGCGIDESIMEKIFDPFFTTKDEHKGIGLGLSTTKDIVTKDFNGSITAHSTRHHGSSFSVQFPLSH